MKNFRVLACLLQIVIMFFLCGCAIQSDQTEIHHEIPETLEEKTPGNPNTEKPMQIINYSQELKGIIDDYKQYLGKTVQELIGDVYFNWYYAFQYDGTEVLCVGESYSQFQAFVLFSDSFWIPDSKSVAVSCLDNILPSQIIIKFEQLTEMHGTPGSESDIPYLSYYFDEIELRIFTDAQRAEVAKDYNPLIMLRDTDRIIGVRNYNETTSLLNPFDTLSLKNTEALSFYVSRFIFTWEELTRQDSSLKPASEIPNEWYYDTTYIAGNGDLYVGGDYLTGLRIPVSHILPFGSREVMTREELIEHWPFAHDIIKYESRSYSFLFNTKSDESDPLMVFFRANADGSINKNSTAHIKYWSGRSPIDN